MYRHEMRSKRTTGKASICPVRSAGYDRNRIRNPCTTLTDSRSYNDIGCVVICRDRDDT